MAVNRFALLGSLIWVMAGQPVRAQDSRGTDQSQEIRCAVLELYFRQSPS